MTRSLREWVLERAEYLVLGMSLAVIGSLVAWWPVFANRMIGSLRALSADVARLQGSEADASEAGVRALLQTLQRGRVPVDMRARRLHDGVAACDRLDHLAVEDRRPHA